MDTEIQSLKQQIGNLRANLESVRIKRSAIADPRDMTDDLRIQEEYLTNELSKLETKLRRLEKQQAEKLKKSRTLWGAILSVFRDSAWGGLNSAIAVITVAFGLLWGTYNYLEFNNIPISVTLTPPVTTIAATDTPLTIAQVIPTITPTLAATVSPTIVPTETTTPTASPTNTATPSPEPTQTDTPVPTNSPTPQLGDTATSIGTSTSVPTTAAFTPPPTLSPTLTLVATTIKCTGIIHPEGSETTIPIYELQYSSSPKGTIPSNIDAELEIIDRTFGLAKRFQFKSDTDSQIGDKSGWVEAKYVTLSPNCPDEFKN